MSKRKSKKRKQNAKQLTKLSRRKFVNRICWSCSGCTLDVDPKFCYDSMYMGNKQKFIKHSWPYLIRLKKSQDKAARSMKDIEAAQFVEAFCPVCEYGDKGTCEFLPGCMLEWKDQLFSQADGIIGKKARKKRKEKIYVEATPTFFSRDNNKWTEIIKGLTGEDSNKKQDTSAAGTG